MNLQHRIETMPQKKLLGMRVIMSLAQNKTYELWHGFMPRRKEIMNIVGADLYSLRIYDAGYFSSFKPAATFEKWAAVEVSDFDHIPAGMETCILPQGLYAVFSYVGAASAAGPVYQHIYTVWLPASGYRLDTRPHLDIMGEKYKREDPMSEEDIWIPITPRQ